MTPIRWASLIALMSTVALSAGVGAQGNAPGTPPDPTVRLRQVLPPDVAERVLATIAQARSHGLAATALEQRALKFGARGVPPADIERSVAEQAQRQSQAKVLLEAARGTPPSSDEVEAGAEAMREGVEGSDVSAIAQTAPSGRSLSVPLYVLGSLTSHGLASADALARVQQRLAQGASDADIESLPAQAHGRGNAGFAPGVEGRDAGGTHPGGGAMGNGVGNGPPPVVPANGAGKANAHGPPAGVPPHPGKP